MYMGSVRLARHTSVARGSSSSSRLPLLLASLVVVGSALASVSDAASFRRWSSYVPPAVKWCQPAEQRGEEPSGLWGCNGENWDKSGPLADWSFAGYGAGMASIPNAPVKFDIKRDFKAAGDGSKDDTRAVVAALKACKKSGGVIYFPPGKYILSGQLNISSNTVLRGAGRDRTTLHFTKSMRDLYGWGPKYIPGRSNSPYTWSGGLISTQKEEKLFKDVGFFGDVTKPAGRGSNRVYINMDRTAFKGKRADEVFKAGEWIAIRMYETKQGDLAKSLSNRPWQVGNKIGPMFGTRMVFTHNTRVIGAGYDYVDFERPLTTELEMKFGPQVFRTANFKVTGVGIEDLEISFPWTAYMGHHEEKGFNGIEFEAAVHSWIRRIRVVNSDAAIKLFATMFTTVSDVHITNSPKTRAGSLWTGRKDGMIADKDGHIGIALHWACFDNLVENFQINGHYYHELLVAGYSAHNVFSHGVGTDITMDHHGAAPHNNLWTDIDVGLGNSTLDWSGDPQHFPYGGANNVFWNIYASKMPVSQVRSARRSGPMSNARMARRQQRLRSSPLMQGRQAREQGFGQVVVDMPVDTNARYIREAGDWFVQYNPWRPVYPANLFSAMRATQSSRLSQPSVRRGLPATLQQRPSFT